MFYNIAVVVKSGAKCLKVHQFHLKNTEGRQDSMLSGEFRHSLDPKNRLFIPAKHREELGETFMVARSIRDECLKVYSMSEWEKYIEPILKMDRKDSEIILRTLHRNAAQVSPDSQGRILLPTSLIEHAKITKGAVVVGCGNYDEIWAEEVYAENVENEDLEGMRAVLESFGL